MHHGGSHGRVPHGEAPGSRVAIHDEAGNASMFALEPEEKCSASRVLFLAPPSKNTFKVVISDIEVHKDVV
jgi:hypothetical protein